jgi:hypothetical protein
MPSKYYTRFITPDSKIIYKPSHYYTENVPNYIEIVENGVYHYKLLNVNKPEQNNLKLTIEKLKLKYKDLYNCSKN